MWIIDNQLGRRNISAYDRSVLALRHKDIIAEKAKENQVLAGGDKTSEEALCQKSDKAVISPIDTKKEIAKLAGVSHDTICKVEKIEEKAIEPIKKLIKSNKISINQAEQAAKLTPEVQEQVFSEKLTHT